MSGRQIIRTCASATPAGVATFTVYLSGGAWITFRAVRWPEGGISVLDPGRRDWRAAVPDDLALLDATDMGRAWRERIERGRP